MPASTSPKGSLTTDDGLPLAELLAKSGDQDFLRVVTGSVLQLLEAQMAVL